MSDDRDASEVDHADQLAAARLSWMIALASVVIALSAPYLCCVPVIVAAPIAAVAIVHSGSVRSTGPLGPATRVYLSTARILAALVFGSGVIMAVLLIAWFVVPVVINLL